MVLPNMEVFKVGAKEIGGVGDKWRDWCTYFYMPHAFVSISLKVIPLILRNIIPPSHGLVKHFFRVV